MTKLNLKKISTLLTVSVFAVFALNADPQLSGSSYVTYTSTVSEASGSYDLADSLSSGATVVLEESTDTTDFCLDIDFAIADTGAVTLSADEASISYTADMLAIQAGWSEMSMGYENWYNAGDVLGDTQTYNASVALTVLSDDESSLVLTPFTELTAGYGVAVNYDLTAEEGLTGVEVVGYYDYADEAMAAATITGTLGIDFAIDGKVMLSDTSDFEVAAVIAADIDDASTYLDVYYTNSESTLYVTPQVYYTVDDTTSLIAYYTATYDMDASSLSNWAELGIKKYVADDFYVFP
ncbi:MAG: hypothetical protein ACPKM0_08835, partial [Pleomorphochaeta sp.]